MLHWSTLMALVAATLVLGGCSKEKGKQGLPPAESWQAPVAGGPGAAAAASNPHASNPHAAAGDPHAGMGMGNDPHAGMDTGGSGGQGGGVDVTALGLQAPDPDRQIDPDKYLSGTIKASSETQDRFQPGTVIFLSVKRADASGNAIGSPLAVKRLVLNRWPLWFRLTEQDAMISGTQFTGDVVIVGWSDQDHDAIGKQPGDVMGQVKASIPQKDLTLVLETVVQ